MEDNNKQSVKSQMEEKIKQTVYQKLGVPGSIVIGDYTYTFKEQQKTDHNIFTYRCQKYSCRVPINITRDNLNKIINKNNNNNDIEYVLKKEHKCKSENEKKTESINNCDTEEEIIKKAKSIIRLNPLKSLTYQQDKLHENYIFLEDVKTNQIIRNIRNMIYPIDAEYLNTINSITITFDEKVSKAANVPFCPMHTTFINPTKSNRKEEIILLTTQFHLKFFAKASYIFIDATFKISPKNFYQVLNIMAYEEINNFTMPICHAIMSHKSLYSYKKIFQELKNLLNGYFRLILKN